MFVIVLAVLLLREANCAGGTHTKQNVLHTLLNNSNYDPSVTPDFEFDIATVVTIQMLIQNIYSVSSSNMDYSIDIMFRQSWMDQRLNYSDYLPSVERLEMEYTMMHNVWTPDTYFANEKSASVHDVTVPNRMIHLYRNGTVLYSIRLSLKLACAMKLHKYPLDEQLCPIIFESYAYTVDNIRYVWHPIQPVQLMPDIEIPQFSANVDVRRESCERDYGDRFACLETRIRLTRKVGYYMVQVFIPSILIVVLSWVSFWVDVDVVPARVSLGLLTVLTMATQSAGARESLPHVSYIKAIDVWMSVCLTFVFLSFLEYACANVAARRHIVIPIPTEAYECQEIKTGDSDVEAKESQPKPNTRPLTPARKIDKLSRVVFPAAFILFNFIFWLYYLLAPNTE